MPGLDKTGPLGQGSRTGRGFGPCCLGLGWRRRFGMGRGLGRYFNWRWPQTNTDKKQALDEYRRALEEELADVKKEQAALEQE